MLRRDRVAQAALRESLAAYFGGRYSRAHKAAQRALAIQIDTPELARYRVHACSAICWLPAAFIACRTAIAATSAANLRRRCPAKAGSGAAEEGGRLLAAEWALDDRDAGRTLELLAELPPGVARRTQALRVKLQAARLAREPMEALKTARLLAKHQGFSPAAAQGLVRSLAAEALDCARDADQLRRVWRELDAADRRDAQVASHAARGLPHWAEPKRHAAGCDRSGTASASLRATSATRRAGACSRRSPALAADWLPRLETRLQACPATRRCCCGVGTRLRRAPALGQGAPPARAGGRGARAAGARPGARPGAPGRRWPSTRATRPAPRRATAPPPPSTEDARRGAAILRGFAAVAQLDRVLGYEPRGRGFESCQPHQTKTTG